MGHSPNKAGSAVGLSCSDEARGGVTGALGQTLALFSYRAPATQSWGAKTQNHGVCGPLRPPQPEPAAPIGVFPVHHSSLVTTYLSLRTGVLERGASPPRGCPRYCKGAFGGSRSQHPVAGILVSVMVSAQIRIPFHSVCHHINMLFSGRQQPG